MTLTFTMQTNAMNSYRSSAATVKFIATKFIAPHETGEDYGQRLRTASGMVVWEIAYRHMRRSLRLGSAGAGRDCAAEGVGCGESTGVAKHQRKRGVPRAKGA